MTPEEMKKRTKLLALEVIKLANKLPPGDVARVIKNQILRSGTSMGANYRAACRAKSPADFISKMGNVEEEADETMYWLELAVEAGLLSSEQIADVYNEADQILAIVVSSIKTARKSK
jgi:four helix bundle protein